MQEKNQTIAALSTPVGQSGIAVIRVSGSDALPILSSVFRTRSGKHRDGDWEHRRLYHGVIAGEGGEVFDEVVCAVMRSPESYTGEDTVEISCHGSVLVVRKILELLFSKGARAAEPGEFTKRAFLNGKIDLIQAEAVCDLIHARSELQRKVAREQLAGGLSRRINRLADEMLSLLGEIEVNIDFIEERIETLEEERVISLLERHVEEIGNLLATASMSRPFREGYRVVITGPVNAGKSSLFNRLLGEERAIVTEIPGTTRDILRESLILEGLVFLVQDTAGLREGSRDRVEGIGVGLAEDAISSADMVLFLMDGSVPLEEDVEKWAKRNDPSRTFLILSKADLPQALQHPAIEQRFQGFSILEVSALTGEGIEGLKKALVESVGRKKIDWIAKERLVLNARLIRLLQEAREKMSLLLKTYKSNKPLEILALEARDILALYEEATGQRYTESLLDNIFSRFCIGK